VIPSFRDVDSLFIELVDSARTIERVQIDSVELVRVYDKFTYPFNPEVRKAIRNANDSIQKAKEQKINKKEKNKKGIKNKK
jgi:hypothetical protein